jgi:hypothetical protein
MSKETDENSTLRKSGQWPKKKKFLYLDRFEKFQEETASKFLLADAKTIALRKQMATLRRGCIALTILFILLALYIGFG